MRKILALMLLASMSGCTYSKPLLVSSASLGPKEIPKAVGSGVSSTSYFLGFRNLPHGDSLELAIKDFKDKSEKKGIHGDTMVNVFVDREISYFPAWWFPIYMESRTTVHGTLIEYKDREAGDYKVLQSTEPKTLNWYERYR